VVVLAVVSLSPVLVGIALFPVPSTPAPLAAPLCSQYSGPYPDSVLLTPQSPVLLPKFDRSDVSALGSGGIGFELGAPADFSGTWNATSPTYVFVMNVSLAGCEPVIAWPRPTLNGTFNITLFPGNYEVRFEPGANIFLTATQPWMATFDRGLDVLQGPQQIPIPANGHVAWTLSAPSNASRFFFEDAMVTTSCDFELAMLPGAAYRAFAAGQGPLNGNGTDELDSVFTSSPGSTAPCAPPSGHVYFWDKDGPFNWTSGDVAVFYNGADYAATLYPFAPFEVSYVIG